MADELSLGTRIRRARGRMRVTVGAPMSQAELAAAIGMSRSAVNGYENDRVMPTVDVIAAMEHVLGVSLAEDADPDEAALRGALHRLHERGLKDLDSATVEAMLELYREQRQRGSRNGSVSTRAS